MILIVIPSFRNRWANGGSTNISRLTALCSYPFAAAGKAFTDANAANT